MRIISSSAFANPNRIISSSTFANPNRIISSSTFANPNRSISSSAFANPNRIISSSTSANSNPEEEEDEGAVIDPPPPSAPVPMESQEGYDWSMVGPPRPPPLPFEEIDSDNLPRIPLSNEIALKRHTKVISALAVDHSGSRFLTGSYDTVRMYDFQGMNSELQSFRQLEPFEGHQVRSLSWSPTSDRFLCVTGSARAKIYDRDGLTLGEFIKGDMYIRDFKEYQGAYIRVNWWRMEP